MHIDKKYFEVLLLRKGKRGYGSMSSEKDILYSHENVSKYLQDRENARMSKEVEEGVQQPRKTRAKDKPEPKQQTTESAAYEQSSRVARRHERRDGFRDAIMGGDYSAFEMMQADMDLRRTIHDSFEDECCGKDF